MQERSSRCHSQGREMSEKEHKSTAEEELIWYLDYGIMKDALKDIEMLGADDPSKETMIARKALYMIDSDEIQEKAKEMTLACAKALAGCPDPRAFVDAVKIMFFNIELLDNGRYKNGEKIRLDMISSFVGFICADAKEHLSWLKDKK